MRLQEAYVLGNKLMEEFNLSSTWRFEFDGGKRRLGRCNGTKKVISVSRYLVELNTEKEVKETILHEIAHALAGVKHGHDLIWEAWARRVGAKPERCAAAGSVNLPKGNYRAICPNCSHSSFVFRKTRKRKACGNCCKTYNNGRFSEQFELKYVREN